MKNNFTLSKMLIAALFTISTTLIFAQQQINVLTKNTVLQEQCATEIIHQERMQTDPEYAARINANEAAIQTILAKQKQNPGAKSGGIYKIPLVVHIIHKGEAVGNGSNISDAQIFAAVNGLNDRFKNAIGNGLDFQMEFELAQRDPNCNATNGIVRVNGSGVANYSSDGIEVNANCGADEQEIKSLSAWPVADYYNIWVVHFICGGTVAGYANYPFGGWFDGTVMRSDYMTYASTTLAHEVGHGFNLRHTFDGDGGNQNCPADNDCNADGDKVCDTPPHKQNDCGSSNPCTGSGIWDNSRYNYMSYCFPSQANGRFTQGQKDRARAAAEVSPRLSLLTSRAILPLDENYSAPPVASCTPTTTSPSNTSGILSAKINGFIVSTGGAGTDGGYKDFSQSCSHYFEVNPNDGATAYIKVQTVNFQQLALYIDWNNDGDFNDANESQYFAEDIAAGTEVNIPITFPSNPPNNAYRRMRAIVDLDDRYGIPDISGSCSNPSQGQAEDYTLYISGAIPSTKVRTADCGITLTTINQIIYCDAVSGAQDYEWKIVHTASGFNKTYIVGSNSNAMSLTFVSGIQTGKTYQVSVRAKVNGSFGQFGNICDITTPSSIPDTKVRTTDCGSTLTTINQAIYCDAVGGAQQYEWEIVHTASGFNKTYIVASNSTAMCLTWVSGIQYNKTYEIRVRVKVGGTFGSFSDMCQVSTPAANVPNTKVRTADCGKTLTALNQVIYCDAVGAAQNYEWEIIHAASGFNKTHLVSSNSNAMCLSWVSGIKYSRTYDVRVRAKVAGVWGNFAVVCQVTTPATVPNTKVRAVDCGIALSAINQVIYCDAVALVQQYEWEIVHAASGFSTVYVVASNSTAMCLSWVSGIKLNRTYDIRVRAKSAGIFGAFNTVCQVTTPVARIGFFEEEEEGTAENSGIIESVEDTKPEIVVYPNPSRGLINVNFTGMSANENIQLEMFDVFGKMVYSYKANNFSEGTITINEENRFAKGVYLVRFSAGELVENRKVIIQ